MGILTGPRVRSRRPAPRPRPTAQRPTVGPPPPDADALAARWCAALDAGHDALRAAGLYLGAQELNWHNRRLEEDRAAAVTLLRELAHDQHRRGLLVRWLAAPRHTRAMLGLPQEIDACIFDLDGVLTTSDALHAEAWADTLDALLLACSGGHRHFVPFDRRNDYDEHLAARPRLQGIHSFLAARGLRLPEGSPDDGPGIDTVAALSARKREALRRRLEREGVAAFESSRSYLEAARMVGLRRGVVSASVNALAMLQRAGLASLLEARVDGETIEARHLVGKPAPDTLLEACRLLEAPAGRTAAFETTAVGVAAARAAGLGFVVGVGRNGDVASLRASDPDVIVRDLATLFEAA
jgi:beta-phosphoglucomutase-like phosphatase (HAD superfamily)